MSGFTWNALFWGGLYYYFGVPGKKVEDVRLKKYVRLVVGGASMFEASRESGVSYSTVMRQMKRPDSPMCVLLAEAGLGSRVPVLSRLSGNALKGFEDFGFFRAHYLARSSSPWAEEAAYKVLELAATRQKEYLVINAPPGSGKALALDTPIATGSGWSTMGGLRVGDQVFGSDGRLCRVVGKSEVFTGHDCYLVSSDDGMSVVADGQHLWSVRLHGHGQTRGVSKSEYPGKTGPKPSVDGRQVHTTEYLARSRSKRPQLQMASPLVLPDLPRRKLPIDPYVLGAWLGDGDSSGGAFTAHPDDAIWIMSRIKDAGYTVRHTHGMRYSVTGSKLWARDGLTSHLRKSGLIGNKHIPVNYFRASSRQRLALLQGLIDTDGHVAPNGAIEFTSINRFLALGVQQLVHSLGAKAGLAVGRATIDGRDCGEKYRVTFYLENAASLPRKSERCRDGVRTPSRYLTVTKVDSVPTQCIQVDSPDHLYLAGEGLLVTHNSSLFVHDIPVWLAVRDRAIRQMIGSSTQNLANMYTGQIRNTFERLTPVLADPELKLMGLAQDAKSTLVKDFGRFKPLDGLWQRKEFVLEQPGGVSVAGKESSFMAFGMDTKFLGGRFDIVLWDDLVTNATLKTEDSRETLIKLWEDESETRLEPNGLLILQGQRLGSNDLYRYCLDLKDFTELDVPLDEQPRKYHHIVYKAHYDDKCTGLHEKTDPPWPTGCLLDPYRLQYRDLMRVKVNKEDKYRVVYQQEDTDPGNSLVQRIWIDGGVRGSQVFPGCWDEMRSAGVVPRNVNGYSVITADPSPTKYWAIGWWIFNTETQIQHLIDLKREPMEAPDFLDWDQDNKVFTGLLEDWYQRSVTEGRPVTHLIVENNAAQRFMLQYGHFKRWMALRGIQVTAHSTLRNKSDEDYGVQTLAPHYKFGRVRLPGNHLDGSRQSVMQLVKEVCQWPNGTTDDTVMMHWFLIWNAPRLFPQRDSVGYQFPTPSWLKAG